MAQDAPRPGSRLLLPLCVAFALRLLWLLICPNEPISDQTIYHIGAANLAAGNGFSYQDGGPIGYWPIGYSAALSAGYWLFGASYTSAYVLNLIFGVAAVLAVHWLTRLLFGERQALVAAWVAAIYPTFVLGTTVHASENLYIPLLLCCVALFVLVVRSGKRGWLYAIGTGILLGLTLMVRPTALVMAPLILLAGLLFREGVLRSAALTGLVCALAFVVALPWGFRNEREFGKFSITSFNGGAVLWMGNHEGSNGRMPADDSVYERFRALGPVEGDAAMRREAIEFIVKNPGRFLQLAVIRAYYSLRTETIMAGWNTPGITKRFGEVAVIPFKLLVTAGYYGLVLLFLISLWRGLRKWSLSREQWLLLACVAINAAPFLILLAMDRYHLPMIPFMLILGTTPLSAWLDTRGNHPAGPAP